MISNVLKLGTNHVTKTKPQNSQMPGISSKNHLRLKFGIEM